MLVSALLCIALAVSEFLLACNRPESKINSLFIYLAIAHPADTIV